MRYLQLFEFVQVNQQILDRVKVGLVVSMPDDPEAVYAVDSVRYNEEKNRVEVVVA